MYQDTIVHDKVQHITTMTGNSSVNFQAFNDVGLFCLTTLHQPIKLICFPYAGGNGMAFSPLTKYLANDTEIWTIEPPGHFFTDGIPETDIDALTERYLSSLPITLWDNDIVLFGHSLGAYIACMVASKLLQKKITTPRLILSGAPPPHLRCAKYQLSSLPLEKLVEVLRLFHGSSSKAQEIDIISLYKECLYADFTLYENFAFPTEISHLQVLIMASYQDAMCSANFFFEWQRYFQNMHLDFLSGNHLFITEQPRIVANFIKNYMKS